MDKGGQPNHQLRFKKKIHQINHENAQITVKNLEILTGFSQYLNVETNTFQYEIELEWSKVQKKYTLFMCNCNSQRNLIVRDSSIRHNLTNYIFPIIWSYGDTVLISDHVNLLNRQVRFKHEIPTLLACVISNKWVSSSKIMMHEYIILRFDTKRHLLTDSSVLIVHEA